ncbi:MAG: TIGR02186 family protein, partial [Sphingomonadaceae bacterium]
MRFFALCLFFLTLTAQTDPILVPEVSQHEVEVRQGFTGTELLLFGAILDPRGERGGDAYDIVVVLKGPTEAVTVREKQRVGGIWINAASTSFRSAPAFFAVASSRPIEDIVDKKTAMIYELGLENIQYSPSGSINLDEQERFRVGLIDLMGRNGFYKADMGGVKINEKVLYQARISLPSNVQTGNYTAETFAIANGRVVASAIAEVEVKKVGFERLVEVFAHEASFLYGLLAV